MAERKVIVITSWPDPLMQERLEDMNFFFDSASSAWIQFTDAADISPVRDWLTRHHLRFRLDPAKGVGQTVKHDKLSAHLLLKNGGGPTSCALCGTQNTPCRQWIEGDDTDSTDYPGAAMFFMCGRCVREKMSPHPRLYAPVEETL